MNVGEVVPDFRNRSAACQGSDAYTNSHYDKADTEDRIYTSDYLIYRNECSDEVVYQDDSQPECSLNNNTRLNTTVLEECDQKSGRSYCEYCTNHDQKNYREYSHDILHGVSKIDTGYLRNGSTVVSLGKHSCEVVMNCTCENCTECDPEEHNRSPHSSGQSSEDRAKSSDVEELNEEQLPLWHYDVVDTVINGNSRSLSVIRIEDTIYELTIEEVSQNQDCKTNNKTKH